LPFRQLITPACFGHPAEDHADYSHRGAGHAGYGLPRARQWERGMPKDLDSGYLKYFQCSYKLKDKSSFPGGIRKRLHFAVVKCPTSIKYD
jgi:hypothetical protein